MLLNVGYIEKIVNENSKFSRGYIKTNMKSSVVIKKKNILTHVDKLIVHTPVIFETFINNMNKTEAITLSSISDFLSNLSFKEGKYIIDKYLALKGVPVTSLIINSFPIIFKKYIFDHINVGKFHSVDYDKKTGRYLWGTILNKSNEKLRFHLRDINESNSSRIEYYARTKLSSPHNVIYISTIKGGNECISNVYYMNDFLDDFSDTELATKLLNDSISRGVLHEKEVPFKFQNLYYAIKSEQSWEYKIADLIRNQELDKSNIQKIDDILMGFKGEIDLFEILPEAYFYKSKIGRTRLGFLDNLKLLIDMCRSNVIDITEELNELMKKNKDTDDLKSALFLIPNHLLFANQVLLTYPPAKSVISFLEKLLSDKVIPNDHISTNNILEILKQKSDHENVIIGIMKLDGIKSYPCLMRFLLHESKKMINECCNEEGVTPLIYALNEDDISDTFLDQLIVSGADVNVKDRFGTTAMHYVIKSNKAERVSKFLDLGSNINENYRHFAMIRTPLITAALDSTKDICELLLRRGANVNIGDDKEKTPIFYARTTDVIKLFIQYGADLNKQDAEGETALMHHKDTQMISMLISFGADLNKQDNKGKTALMYHRSLQSIKALIDSGANVNLQDNEGKTALVHYLSDDFQLFNWLLNTGQCDLSLKDKSGLSVIEHAALLNYQTVPKLIQSANPPAQELRRIKFRLLEKYHSMPDELLHEEYTMYYYEIKHTSFEINEAKIELKKLIESPIFNV